MNNQTHKEPTHCNQTKRTTCYAFNITGKQQEERYCHVKNKMLMAIATHAAAMYGLFLSPAIQMFSY